MKTTPGTLILLLAASAAAGGLDDFTWREEFEQAKRWTPQPTWLSNASRAARASAEDGTVCFGVDEPGRGMKWSAAMEMTPLDELPYLVVRYRARNLRAEGEDYFIYLDDRVRAKQLNAIRLCDVVADGSWHVAAVDVTTLTAAEAVHSMAVQVQAAKTGHYANGRKLRVTVIDKRAENRKKDLCARYPQLDRVCDMTVQIFHGSWGSG